jgi:hypothetical protein
MSMEQWWSDAGRRNPKYSEDTTLPTINPMRTGLGSNADFRSERPPEPWHGLGSSENLAYGSCDIIKGTVRNVCRL